MRFSTKNCWPERVAQALGEYPAQQVVRPARRIGHDDPDRLGGPVGAGRGPDTDDHAAERGGDRDSVWCQQSTHDVLPQGPNGRARGLVVSAYPIAGRPTPGTNRDLI